MLKYLTEMNILNQFCVYFLCSLIKSHTLKFIRLSILFLVFFFSITLHAQKNRNFTGKIVYENQYESNVTGMDGTMLSSMMGSKWTYFIKGGNYKFEMNGMHIQSQYYDPLEFKLYTKFANMDTLTWIDVREDVNEVLSHELLKTDEFIMGLKCNALVLTTSRGKETYYFNRRVSADPLDFQKHKFLNMAYVLKHTNSIPLKIVLEIEEMNFTSTAVEIEELELEDGIFKVPDVPKKPSNF